jgi:hypothetical protein
MNRNLFRWALATVSLTVLAFCVPGRSESVTQKKTAITAKPPVEAPLPAGIRYESGSRRDPFINPLRLRKAAEDLNEEVGRGAPPPGISGMFIAEVALLGVSSREDGRTAVFRGPDRRAYFLQQGDKLFDGYLKEIGPDFVLLIRETRLKSGKVLTQDVQKRLRTP